MLVPLIVWRRTTSVSGCEELPVTGTEKPWLAQYWDRLASHPCERTPVVSGKETCGTFAREAALPFRVKVWLTFPFAEVVAWLKANICHGKTTSLVPGVGVALPLISTTIYLI